MSLNNLLQQKEELIQKISNEKKKNISGLKDKRG